MAVPKHIDKMNQTVHISVPNTIIKKYWEDKLIDPFYISTYGATGEEYAPIIEVEAAKTPEHHSVTTYANQVTDSLPLQTIEPVQSVVMPKVELERNHRFHSKLNERYTFENFVVGNSNHASLAAAMAISENLGGLYNPLFIFGGVGLGKTHMMQAVGHAVLNKNPMSKIHFVTAEQFMNDFVESIRTNTMEDFRNYYRSLDLLMIDDAQFMAKKKKKAEEDDDESGIQTEFFNTFEALKTSGKQIILTSDRSPNQLKQYTDRLISRFNSGMTTDIKSPEYETKLAILLNKRKAEGLEDKLSDEILETIVARVSGSIRDLEGAFNTIHFQSVVLNNEVTLEFAEKLLSDNMDNSKKDGKISILSIQTEVSEYFGITVKDMKSKARRREISIPRQIAMFLVRDVLGESYPRIGQAFGGKDHSTVMHAEKNIRDKQLIDSKMKSDIESIRLGIF
jgi:chromosomal replication initiator protein